LNKKGEKNLPFFIQKSQKKGRFKEAFKQVINNGPLAERLTTTRFGVYAFQKHNGLTY
jgi:hypothetical protein